ncbi:FAD-binding oxidoreductase [Haloarchaeobius salinus]|uniref:FAD-binding oxidoreductase n=1 Tax=Haloarchaeobius salinus TaxID=1198298 RepID=UPI00210A6382|nr:FAD-binding oxidoreductase [Haloarchaeobius salinus]
MATVNLDTKTVETFERQIGGTLLRPGEPDYDEATSVWNAMVEKEPALIARCRGASDVIAAVTFARNHDLRLAVKGGGHNVAGNGLCDDGLVIDLSPMDAVRVDPAARTARVQGGATMADLDRETQTHGLAVTGGIISSTGVAGLTLGGGWGRLGRKYGLAIDNLRSADVVTADGDLVQASDDQHSDLFWALRGGGGNFGVVTSLEFDLHEVGPEIPGGVLAYTHDDVAEVLRFYREFAAEAPDAASVYAAFIPAPPEPRFPEEQWGETLLLFRLFYAGDLEEAKAVFEPFRAFGEPIINSFEPMPYVEFQQISDDLFPAGRRYYWKSNYFDDLPDGLIDQLVAHVEDLPTPYSSIFFEHLGGEISRVDSDATAYPHRDPLFAITVSPAWTDSDDDQALIEWARDVYEDLAAYASDGVYVNVLSNEGKARIREAYGGHFERLRSIKTEWDPENLFNVNQNIAPTG